MTCRKDKPHVCATPESNEPNGVCVLQGCPQAGASYDTRRMEVVKHDEYHAEAEITGASGGDAGLFVDSLERLPFECACGEVIEVPGTWKAYPHDKGLEDAQGRRWWLYITCPRCKYDWAFHKVQRRVDRGMDRAALRML